jgi:hypothetical protein
VFKPYLFRLSFVLSVLGVHAIVLASTLVLEDYFSLLVMFDVLFYLLYVFMCDRRQHVDREQVQRFEEEDINLWLEKGK